MIELTHVVKNDVCLRQCLQPANDLGVVAQVAQHTVTNAAIRNLPDLFFDCLQRFSWSIAALDTEQERKDCREPANRARQIHIVEDLLASMPFNINEH